MRRIEDAELSGKDREAIREACRILRERFPVERIVLFGSKARREDDEESDIDLLVLTSRRLSWRERRAATAALYPLELKHEVVISALVISSDEWERGVGRVLPIHDEVERDGVAA